MGTVLYLIPYFEIHNDRICKTNFTKKTKYFELNELSGTLACCVNTCSVSNNLITKLLCQKPDVHIFGRLLYRPIYLDHELDHEEYEQALQNLGIQFEFARISFRTNRLQYSYLGNRFPKYYADFLKRFFLSKYTRGLELYGLPISLSNFSYNLEEILLRFCLSDHFGYLESEYFTVSCDFVAIVFQSFKLKNCVFDVKPRFLWVSINQEEVYKLAEKLDIKLLHNVENRYKHAILFWKRVNHNFVPSMVVDIHIARTDNNVPKFYVVVFLHKYSQIDLKSFFNLSSSPVALTRLTYLYGADGQTESEVGWLLECLWMLNFSFLETQYLANLFQIAVL
ncbi:hypothetical protein L596_000071 [Steinernema carpocapsae]|uniref:Uncharacterized protein n=1 Tax=Steinernema carpocapsae TaxID=34508 RepID=A0A4U8UHJ6_STECR|nr:hypothetical protein L596_000071 [Steinernema carpocapsae]